MGWKSAAVVPTRSVHHHPNPPAYYRRGVVRPERTCVRACKIHATCILRRRRRRRRRPIAGTTSADRAFAATLPVVA